MASPICDGVTLILEERSNLGGCFLVEFSSKWSVLIYDGRSFYDGHSLKWDALQLAFL